MPLFANLSAVALADLDTASIDQRNPAHASKHSSMRGLKQSGVELGCSNHCTHKEQIAFSSVEVASVLPAALEKRMSDSFPEFLRIPPIPALPNPPTTAPSTLL
ncbi:hypothetical protein V6N11_053754 [Hibiscus sabdariffa]|uniref:Uncharacterized protein n=1 Tax=Hibiscus sabdariffa TaxID=183260 RepID=A0ABR2S208_9ROSI